MLVVLATSVSARPVTDQQTPYGESQIEVGGTFNYLVAQTVTAGVSGDLMRVELGIGCTGGELIVEIRDLWPGRPVPGTVVRSTTTIPAADIPNPPAVHTFDLATRVTMNTGDQFAIVLRNDTGVCKAIKAPRSIDGTAYRGGQGWFQRASGPAESWFQFLDFGDTGDLGFKTIVNVAADSPPCIVNGFATPFPGFLPVCRCIEDEGLRDFRCALLNPSYFLFRNIPTPLRTNDKFQVKWTLVVYAPMKGVVEVNDALPAGFTGAPKGPLTFFVDQVPVGQSITLTYDAVAPSKPGRYRLVTGIGEGNMQTFVEVLSR